MVDSSFPLSARGASVDPNASREGVAARGDRRLHALLFVLFAVGSIALTARGYDFYRLSWGERVDHPDFRILGPGSNVGHGYGIAGTVLILTNLLYLARRRFARLSVGSLRAWLDVHVFTGLFGGLLVLFHSAFQVRSAVSLITVTCLGLVMITGIVGRYLYALSPKIGDARLHTQLATLDCGLPGLSTVITEQLALLPAASGVAASPLQAIRSLPVWRRQARARAQLFDRIILHYTSYYPVEISRLGPIVAACRREIAGEVRALAAAALLKSWRSVHRLSALLLVALVSVHIGIAWYYGFVWVFS
jgi:dihydropyrimidine dehydrogenase (NAD+) subunit PreT